MKIAFIYPTVLDKHGYPTKYKKAFLPPLNLAILASLTPNNHDVNIINEYVEKIDFSVTYDLVAITALTIQAPRAYQIASTFRTKKVPVVLGGVHPSLLPDEAIKYADSVMIGEAESLWGQIISDIEKHRLQQFYKATELPNLKERCLPEWQDFNLNIYRRSFGNKKMPRMPIFTTKGCIHNCKYCSVTKFFGRTYRSKPVSLVVEEIDSVNADSYFFVDDNIICVPEYSEELFKALIGKDIRWLSQASTQILKYPKLIDLAAKAGCRSLLFGIESINTDNLKSVRKSFNNPDQYIELAERLESVGIRPLFSMIIGFDHDDSEQLQAILEFFKKTSILQIVLFILTPLPATELYDQMSIDNRIIDKNWTNYDLCHVVYNPKNFTPSQLESEYWKLYKDLYSLPTIIKKLTNSFIKTKFNYSDLIRNTITQFNTYNQIRHYEHPISMGISKISSIRNRRY